MEIRSCDKPIMKKAIPDSQIFCPCGLVGRVHKIAGKPKSAKTACPGCFKVHHIRDGPILGVDWHNPEHGEVRPFYVELPEM